MSDATDAILPPAGTPAAPATAPADRHRAGAVTALDLIHLAQGFYFVFWGLLLTLMMAAQMLAGIPLPPVLETLLAAGVLGTLVGTWRLSQARHCGDRWHSQADQALGWAVLMTYAAVFVYLWRWVPTSLYLQTNALMFPVVCILYMVAFNRATATLATSLGNQDLHRESQFCSIGALALLLAPFLGLLGYAAGMAYLHGESLFSSLRMVLSHVHAAWVVIVLLPVALTLSLAWGAKDMVLHLLAACEPEPPPPTTSSPV